MRRSGRAGRLRAHSSRMRFACARDVADLARASSGVLAAWEQVDGDGATTYVRSFPALPAGTTTVRDGTAVHRVRYGTSWYSPRSSVALPDRS